MKPNIWDKLGDFVLGKGFYIVLTLCVATIGVSGYYLIRSANTVPEVVTAPVTGNPTVVVPGEKSTQSSPVTPPVTAKPREDKLVPTAPPTETKPSAPAPQPQQEQPAPVPAKPAAAVYTWPVKGEVLRGVSVDALAFDPTMGDWRTHEGMDIAAAAGLKVLCVSDGVVLEVFEDDLMGTTVTVDHGGDLISTYANLAEDVAVTQGQQVSTGTVLGTVGSGAIAESALPSHIHLEMTKNGQPVDPTEFLPVK